MLRRRRQTRSPTGAWNFERKCDRRTDRYSCRRAARSGKGSAVRPPSHKPTPDAASGLHPHCDISLFDAPLRHRVAPVAIAALPVRLNLLAEVFEDESSAALRALAVLHHCSKLRSVLHTPRFVVGEVSAEIDRCEPLGGKTLPATAAIFTHESMTNEQHEHETRFATRNAGLVREIIEMNLLAQGHLLECDRDARGFLDVVILTTEKVRLNAAILDALQHRADGGIAVVAGASCLLIV